MKRIGVFMTGALLLLAMVGCTNDEGEPEFEILNPQDTNEETALSPENKSDPTRLRTSEPVENPDR